MSLPGDSSVGVLADVRSPSVLKKRGTVSGTPPTVITINDVGLCHGLPIRHGNTIGAFRSLSGSLHFPEHDSSPKLGSREPRFERSSLIEPNVSPVRENPYHYLEQRNKIFRCARQVNRRPVPYDGSPGSVAAPLFSFILERCGVFPCRNSSSPRQTSLHTRRSLGVLLPVLETRPLHPPLSFSLSVRPPLTSVLKALGHGTLLSSSLGPT